MNHLTPSRNHAKLTRVRGPRYVVGVIALVVGMSVVGACSNVSTLTKERVARSEVAVQEAQRTIGQAETGAVELQSAKQHLDAANNALTKGQQQEAERRAEQAQLHAELAVAKVQSAEARRAADEVLASTETLRSETERNTPATR
jgi:hypothetical protein